MFNFILKNNLLTNLQPVYFFARFFGLLPFSLVCDENGDIKRTRVKVFDLIWFTISISVYMCLIYLYQTEIDFSHGSKTLVFCDTVNDLIQLVLPPCICCWDMYNRPQFVDVLKKLTSFDKEVWIPCSSVSTF